MSTTTGNILATVPKMDGTNYHPWKFAVSMALRRAGSWNVLMDKVDELTKPVADRKVRATEAEKAKKTEKLEEALTTIGLTMDPSQYQYVEECSDGAEAWKALAEVYEKNSRANRIALKRALYGFTHDTERPIQDYIGGITTLASRLRAIGVSLTDIDIVDVLIFNLDESWSNIAASLSTASDDTNALTAVKSALVDEEGRRGGTPDAVKESAMYGSRGSDRVTCYNCGKRGHISRDCPISRGRDKRHGKDQRGGRRDRRRDDDDSDDERDNERSNVVYDVDAAY